MSESYLIDDVLTHHLKAVFCGTALGHESLRQRAYYAKAGNQFWPVLYRTGLTPRLLSPQEYPLMPSLGYGLTDLCKTASGNDDQLPANAFDAPALQHKILTYQPHILAFTSKNAASAFLQKPVGQIAYGLQKPMIGRTQLFVLPSTSGQARRWWREDIWYSFAQHVKKHGWEQGKQCWCRAPA